MDTRAPTWGLVYAIGDRQSLRIFAKRRSFSSTEVTIYIFHPRRRQEEDISTHLSSLYRSLSQYVSISIDPHLGLLCTVSDDSIKTEFEKGWSRLRDA